MDNTVLVMNLKDMLNKMQMQLNILFKLKKKQYFLHLHCK